MTASGAQDIGDTGSVEDQFVPCVILCVKLALPPAASLASPRLPVGGPCPRALTYDKARHARRTTLFPLCHILARNGENGECRECRERFHLFV